MTVARRSSRWRPPPGCRGSPRRSGTRPAPRRRAPASCCGPCWTRGSATSRWGSAARATTDGGAGLLRGLGARVGEGAGRRGPGRAGPAARRGPPADRVRRDATRCSGRTGPRRSTGRRRARRRSWSTWLDARHARWADALDAATGRRERETRGAGAAGGLGFALLALADRFADLRLQPGIDLVMAEARFEEALAAADLVITGEGRIDAQTAFGKTAMGVAKRAQAAGKRVPGDRRRGDAGGDRGAGGRRGAGRRGQRRAADAGGGAGRGHGPVEAAAARAASTYPVDLVHCLVHHPPVAEMFNIHDAKTHFSRLVERARQGERIMIARDGVPVAMLVAIEPETRPPPTDRDGSREDRHPRRLR